MPAMRMDIIAWRTAPLTQWRSYCLVIGVVVAISLVHAYALRLLRRAPTILLIMEALVVGAACRMAFQASPFLGRAFLCGLVPSAALLAPFVVSVHRRRERVRSAAPFALAVALQGIPLAWGVWITMFDERLGYLLGVELAAAGFSLWRATRRAREGTKLSPAYRSRSCPS